MSPRRRVPGPRLFTRYLLGAVLIVAAVATASAVAAFHEVDKVVEAFKEDAALDLGSELAEADAGKPQTIMLIGSDKRAEGRPRLRGAAPARTR